MQSYLPTWNIIRKNIILQIPFSVISAQRKKDINMQKNWNVHWLTTCFKFKYPICGYSEGIITGIAEPEIGTGDICISRLYDVFCGENALISCDSFEAIHHDDIEVVIGNDKTSVRRAVPSNIYWGISKRSGFSVRYYPIFLPWQKKLPSHI